MQIPRLAAYVGEVIPVRYSFLSRLKDFRSTSQALTGASVAWVSQSSSLATFVNGSDGLVTSDQGTADGIANDAVIGAFTMLAAGICTVTVSVSATNPAATYVGVIQFEIEAIPTP